MGNLIWHQWGRLVALTSGAWTAWGGLWAIFYRKFLWDFVGGELGPVGIIPSPSSAIFVNNIVKLPIIQSVCILNGLLTIAFEWPLFPGSFVYRSLTFKSLFYLQAALISGLVYQCADAAVFYIIAILAYTAALGNGEVVGVKKSAEPHAV
ncbi:hypothetical protein CROQUDRAFT_656771 [Cronartium quercuum f. sp. fusiforme G11]|uniref:DUF7727 domain-containing protein n=1 Tax=Cronartium quercuum f. sp. fusiforme G11 TaxID=708437 RepID=A0A9P6NJ67_9BASI|nr:hypothetical protein CROQUDRAFT_656771 [Cronartium quercuum f. sp. fusiforme G11]